MFSYYEIFNFDDGTLVCCMVDYGLVTSYLTEREIRMLYGEAVCEVVQKL